MGNKWTEEDFAFLRENYFNLGAKECANQLGRTYEATKKKAQILGIKGDKAKRFSSETYDNKLLDMDCNFYRIEPYVTNRVPVLHECIKGHIWKVRPDSILSGTGCPDCNKFGFNMLIPAIVYYVKITTNDNIFYKIGVN